MLIYSKRPPILPSETLPFRAKVALSGEVLATYVQVRWLLARRGLPAAMTRLRADVRQHASGTASELRLASGRRCGWIVVRILRRLPTDGRCLMRSLVLAAVLARRGIYGTLVIGVRPDPTFAAHAWIEVDGEAVLPTDTEEFHRLLEI